MLMMAGMSSAGLDMPKEWVLVFEDHFKGGKIDSRKWTRIPYVGYRASDWRRYQSQEKKLVGFGGSSIKLWGKYGKYVTQNNQKEAQETYACGGIQSLGKFSFQYGRVDVRARFTCVQGCWPAIWMMPDSSPGGWPNAGEIDIMEHLNHEGHVYQTIHLLGNNGKHMSRGIKPNPKIEIKAGRKSRRKGAPPVQVSDWHVYSVHWTPQGITFLVDDKVTGTINSSISSKWPFSRPDNTFYLIIDQQIGGKWVEGSGSKGIDKETLSKKGAVLEVDYVRVYSLPKYKQKPAVTREGGAVDPPPAKKKKKASRKKKTKASEA